MYSNISSLQDNFLEMEEVLYNVDYNFNLIALIETWHANKNLFKQGILPRYQKYEGISGTTKSGGCGFYLKKLSLISFVMIYPKNTTAKIVSLKHFDLK